MSGKKKTKFELLVGAVDKFSAPFRRFNQKMEESTQGLRKFREASRNLGREAGFAKLAGAAKTLTGSLGTVWGEAQKLGTRLMGLAGKFSLLFGAAGGGLLALAHGTAGAGDAAAKAAQRAGVAVDVWQEYAYAASLCDASNEEMQKSLAKVGEQAIKAATGGKEQARWFQRAGISVKDANGKLKSSDQLMMELSDSVKHLSDAGQKAKALDLAKGILGEEGVKLMPMLNAGAEGMRRMRGEAHELGLVLSADTAAASEEFNDELTRAKGGLRGLGFTIGKEFLPFATRLVKAFTEWIKANRALVQTKVREWVEKLQAYLPTLQANFKKLCDGVGKLFNWIDRFAGSIGGWGNLMTGVAAVMAGPLLLAVGGAAKAFLGFGMAIMATPIGWILAAIAAVAGGAYLIYKNWDAIAGWFKGQFSEIAAAFKGSWVKGILTVLARFNPVALVVKGVNALINYFTGIDLLAQGQELVASFGRGIEQKWTAVVSWFKDKVKTFTDWMPDWLKEEIGVSGGSDEQPDTPSGPSAFPAPPLDAASMTAPSHQSTLTRVEREEVKVTLVPPDGWQMHQSGGSDGVDISGAYSGQMALGY